MGMGELILPKRQIVCLSLFSFRAMTKLIKMTRTNMNYDMAGWQLDHVVS